MERAAGRWTRPVQPGGFAGGRPGGADLHQRHHRTAQGRADSAARADRQPARFRVQPQLVRLRSHACRQHESRDLLESGRLGLDGRADGCAAARALFRSSDRRLQRPLRPSGGVRDSFASPRDAQFPVSHRAQGDDEGRAASAQALHAAPAGPDERGRGGGRRGVRLLPGRAGRGRQRNVRPDRGQLHRRQLRHERPPATRHRLAGQAEQHGPRLSGPPGGADR